MMTADADYNYGCTSSGHLQHAVHENPFWSIILTDFQHLQTVSEHVSAIVQFTV